LILSVAVAVVATAGVLSVYPKYSESVAVFSMPANKQVVVIDAGHGGWDPGKVGDAGTLEKDINLKIAEQLQSYLELGGAVALVTRDTDEATGETKRDDLKERVSIADVNNASMLISIHQNSFPDAKAHGAQVFYYSKSEESKLLAECVQAQFAEFMQQGDKRLAKPNSDYYILKRTTSPAIIVECGFLSNESDESLLNEEQYQEKVAWAIYMGVLNYFSETQNLED
jgi:N-acetylmuramoyl-L-alanine amidase